MVTAPTPPTKPTLPTIPTVSPVATTTTSATTTAPSVNIAAISENKVRSESPNAEKQIEGTSTKSSSGDKTFSDSRNETQIPKTTSATASLDTQDGASAMTAVPSKTQVPENKAFYPGYGWFVIVVVAVAAVLLGLRLYKAIMKQPCSTTINHSDKANTLKDKQGVDMIISQQDTVSKTRSNFEIRV